MAHRFSKQQIMQVSVWPPNWEEDKQKRYANAKPNTMTAQEFHGSLYKIKKPEAADEECKTAKKLDLSVALSSGEEEHTAEETPSSEESETLTAEKGSSEEEECATVAGSEAASIEGEASP